MKQAIDARRSASRWWISPFVLALATAVAAQDAEPVAAVSAPTVAAAPPDLIAPTAPGAAEWQLMPPEASSVDFRGLANFDQAGVNTKAALFVGVGHPALAAVTALSFAINAAVIDNARASQKSGVQREADKVLLPYESILADYRSSDLYAQAAARARGAAKTPSAIAWQVHASPVFSMTQDQKAIVLDSVVQVRSAQAPAPVFTGAIRVVGAPHEDADPTAYWQKEQGLALRSKSEDLLAEALRLALQFAEAPTALSTTGAKSLRFMQGDTEHVERAELLQQDCSRTVFRTLRGALMSVPTLRPDPSCAQQPAQIVTVVKAD